MRRRTIDTVLVSAGVLGVVVFAVAAGLLTWGNSFAAALMTVLVALGMVHHRKTAEPSA